MTDIGLPDFPYHPDPVATGSIRESDAACCACGRARGYLYVLPLYSAQDVPGRVCPCCIADGTAADRFDGEFTDASELAGLPETVVDHVARHTPGFSTWQERRWLRHCGDAAVFLRPVGIRELRGQPDALEVLTQEMREGFHEERHLEHFLNALDAEGNPSAYLFRCQHCDAHLAYADFT